MTSETVALTYAELADRLGIEVASAKMRARRGNWRREPGNDGKTRVQVPTEVLDEAPPLLEPELPPEVTALTVLGQAHAAELVRIEAAHRATVDMLRQAHADEIGRLEAARQRDREDHVADIDRIRADHAAEVNRLVQSHQQALAAQHPVMRWMASIIGRARG